MKAQSALSVKEANLKAMTAFIYTQGSATKQMFEHELGLSLPTITQNLRAMEADGLIARREYPQIPPRVEYSLTDRGKSLMAVLDQLCVWGEQNRL